MQRFFEYFKQFYKQINTLQYALFDNLLTDDPADMMAVVQNQDTVDMDMLMKWNKARCGHEFGPYKDMSSVLTVP